MRTTTRDDGYTDYSKWFRTKREADEYVFDLISEGLSFPTWKALGVRVTSGDNGYYVCYVRDTRR